MIKKPVQSLFADKRNRKDGKLAIRIQLFYNGEQLFIPLKMYYTTEEWAIINDFSDQRGKKSVIHGSRLLDERAKISFSQKRLATIIDNFEKKDIPYSVRDLKDEFESRPVDSISRIYLTNLFDEVYQNKAKSNRAFTTLVSYTNAKKSFVLYISQYLKKDDNKFRITSIDACWLEDYKVKMGDRISETTKNDYIINLRAVFNYAIRQNLISRSIYPFDENNTDNYYNIQTSPKTKKALTPEEFDKLKVVRKALTPAQQEAWDYFMLSYLFNGANLRDLAELKYRSINKHDRTITFTRKKSSRRKKKDDCIVIEYNEQIKRIIELRGNEESPDTYIFPIFSGKEKSDNEKTEIVKYKTQLWGKKWSIIAKKAQVRDDLTYQMARHTYATVATLNGVPEEEIMKAMGHTTIKQTRDYIATLPKNVTPINEKVKQESVPLNIFD